MLYILYALSAVLCVLKLIGTITVSWWVVAAPALIAIGWTIFVLGVLGGIALWATSRKKQKKTTGMWW